MGGILSNFYKTIICTGIIRNHIELQASLSENVCFRQKYMNTYCCKAAFALNHVENPQGTLNLLKRSDIHKRPKKTSEVLFAENISTGYYIT